MSEWIPCSERFPEKDHEVIVKGHFPFEPKCIFRQDEDGAYAFKKIGKHFGWIFIHGVTHWRPLDD